MTLPAVALRADEAVELSHAWVSELAAAHGIRALIIKGPTLARQGLREERVSADTDVLIEPQRFAEFCDLVVAVGWRERPSLLIAEHTSSHSRTFVREGWPCDLDVHHRFPGFLAEPDDVFDALWARRTTLEFAHQGCAVTDRAGSALILALHSLRGTQQQERHPVELAQLTRVTLTDGEKAGIASLAAATGSAATLADVLPRLGIHVDAPTAELASPELREWRELVDVGAHGSYFWLRALRHAKPRDWPRLAWRAIWPTDHDLLIARPEIPDAFWPKLRGRVARWGRGLRSLPRAVRAIWHNRG